MALLTDRRLLITGVLSTRSIAYGIAKACRREGAILAFTYANADFKDRVEKIAAEFGPCPVLRCDVDLPQAGRTRRPDHRQGSARGYGRDACG